jgi:hypothetical protein
MRGPLLATGLVALLGAGCGATPPQAPAGQARKLDSAAGDIAAACGLTYQVTAFGGKHRAELANLESSATSSAHELASVYARNPGWIYQGDTVREIVDDAVAMLRTCGLDGAASALAAVRPRPHSGSR